MEVEGTRPTLPDSSDDMPVPSWAVPFPAISDLELLTNFDMTPEFHKFSTTGLEEYGNSVHFDIGKHAGESFLEVAKNTSYYKFAATTKNNETFTYFTSWHIAWVASKPADSTPSSEEPVEGASADLPPLTPDSEGEEEAQEEAEAPGEAATFTLQVVTLTKLRFSVEVLPNDTVANVKTKLSSQTGLAMEHQALVFAGKQLEDDGILKELGISDISTLFLVVRNLPAAEVEALGLPEAAPAPAAPRACPWARTRTGAAGRR
jgi:hypothetical protein